VAPLEQFGVVMVGVVLAFIALVIVVVLFLRWGSRSGAVRGLVLEESSPPVQATPTVTIQPSELVGKRGVAVTTLRPAGTAMFGNRRLDVVTEATFIPQGATVEVTAVEGKRVIVRQVTEEPPGASGAQ